MYVGTLTIERARAAASAATAALAGLDEALFALGNAEGRSLMRSMTSLGWWRRGSRSWVWP
jgi:hypothetical protein